MEPLDAAYFTCLHVSASTAQVRLTGINTEFTWPCLARNSVELWLLGYPCTYIPNSGPIADKSLDQWTKNNGAQVIHPRPALQIVKSSSQFPQSRLVSLVMVQVAPSEQLTT